MRTPLGVLALLATLLLGSLLGGCGDETSTGGEGDEPDRQPTGEVTFELVEMVTETAVGGTIVPEATAVPDQLALQGFAGQFEDDRMLTRLTQVLDGLEVPDDKAAYAAVVAIGCEVPPEVTVSRTDTQLVIADADLTPEQSECFAPMTSVAVVLVDEAVAG